MHPELLESSMQLPSPKGVALAVIALSKREDVTLHEIAQVVQTDPALSGRLVKLANNTSRISRPVVSVQEAVARQGVQTVCQLALGFSLVDQYRKGGCDAFDYPRYWSHSLLMGLAMQALASRIRAGDANELFICGLLAQMGQLALATAYPQPYSSVLAEFQRNPTQSLLVLERAQLETDHAELGTGLLSAWGIPAVYTDALSVYEGPNHPGNIQDSRVILLVSMLQLAHLLADTALAPPDQRLLLSQAWLAQAARLDIPAEDAGHFVDDVIEEWHDWGTLLEIHTVPLPSFTDFEQAPVSTDPKMAPLRIVVADSNEFTRRKTMALLTGSGAHTVYATGNGDSAVAIALDVAPHVVIAHHNLQQMSALDLCQTLRELEAGRGLYILIMDDDHNAEHAARAHENGADAYVSSIINAKDLNTRLVAAHRMAKLKQDWDADRAQLHKLASELNVARQQLAKTPPEQD